MDGTDDPPSPAASVDGAGGSTDGAKPWPDEVAAALAAHPLIAPLHDDEREVLLSGVHTEQVPAGTRLMAAGDEGGELLLVLRGTAAIVRGGVELARVGTGSWLGELALLEDRPARSDVVAVDEMLVGVLDRDQADEVLEIDGVALQLDAVAGRLLDCVQRP